MKKARCIISFIWLISALIAAYGHNVPASYNALAIIFYPTQYPLKPKGYSTAAEIASKNKLGQATLCTKLKRLREAGKIEAIQVRNKYNQVVWAYKD